VIVDSSALIAVARNEPERAATIRALVGADTLKISAANWLEAYIVVDNLSANSEAQRRFKEPLADLHLDIVAVDADLDHIARTAFSSYGRGRHPARLNFGDCFSYTLDKRENEPLLFKGSDFSQTDIVPALP